MLPPENQELEIPTTASSTATQYLNKCDPTATMNEPMNMFSDEYDVDSTCSTPYVSAPSSPGRGHGCSTVAGFYYSAPASPMHFILSTAATAGGAMSNSSNNNLEMSTLSSSHSFEFDFSSASKNSTNGTSSTGSSMSSADELFLNGQIRPMKLSSHLQRPQVLAPLLDLDEAADDEVNEVDRGRAVKMRDRSLRRRTRSMSPMRTTPFGWHDDDDEDNPVLDGSKDFLEEKKKQLEEKDAAASGETTPCESGASSRSSSVGRSSSRWIFLKEFLYRSKSEGRNNGHKFWGSLSFSPVKDKIKMEKVMPSKFPSNFSKEKATKTSATPPPDLPPASESSAGSNGSEGKRAKHSGLKDVKKKAVNGVGKRRVPPSPHELHYTANRAQAEEMRKKTFLPYRQGLLGCLGFSSKSYGAMNGLARALNPVSSRGRGLVLSLSKTLIFC